MSDNENVEYRCEDKIALISLNRPKKLNAIDDDMVRSIMATMQRFDMDDEAHTAIFCGNGRAFCSGADVLRQEWGQLVEELVRCNRVEPETAAKAIPFSIVAVIHFRRSPASCHPPVVSTRCPLSRRRESSR